MSPRLAVAQRLAAKGLRLFPLREGGKQPAIKGWQDAATTTFDRLEEWFGHGARNIGVATGPSGLIVLDTDQKHGKDGDANLRRLAGAHAADLDKTFTAESPTGSRHYYFAGPPVPDSVGKLAEAVDVRGRGGLVVGPGSTTDKGVYRVIRNVDIQPVPQWLLDEIEAVASRVEAKTLETQVELDTPAAWQAAINYLRDAPASVEGQGGNDNAYRVACALKDIGLSAEATHDAMCLMSGWNERCSPPWDDDELATIIHNAFAYGQNDTGARSVEAMFDILPDAEPPPAAPPEPEGLSFALPVWHRPADLAKLPPRPWVFGTWALREKVTEIIAPGGIGKSSVSLAAAVSIATGEPLLGVKVHQPGPVIVINNEDDRDELDRRLAAICLHFGITDAALAGRLYVYSGASAKPFLIAKRKGQVLRPTKDQRALATFCREVKAAALIVDPFVETHEGQENDNGELSIVARLYREIAVLANVPCIIIHHTRKPPSGSSTSYAGNADTGRGASALPNVARIVLTVYGMDDKDAKKYGVSEADRFHYVRIDEGKANLAPLANRPLWFKKHSVALGNGDSVGVIAPVELKEREVTEEPLFLEAVAGLLDKHNGEVTLHTAATELEGSAILDGLKYNTIRRRLGALLKHETVYGDWRIWLEGERSKNVIRGERTA